MLKKKYFFLLILLVIPLINPDTNYNTYIIHDSPVSDILVNNDGSQELLIGVTNFYNYTSGQYEPYNYNETLMYQDGNNIIFQWADKKVTLETYVATELKSEAVIKAPSETKISPGVGLDVGTALVNADFSTTIEKIDNSYVFEHTMNENQPKVFGYNIIPENTNCQGYDTYIICDEQKLDFSDAVKQGIQVDLASDYVEFTANTTDLSYIDPDLTISSGELLMCGNVSNYSQITVTNGYNITICPYNGTSYTGTLIINTSNFTLGINSYIKGNGTGYRGGASGINGEGIGGGSGDLNGGSGAGYGGVGGIGYGGASAGITYGSSNNVTLIGSGGGGGGSSKVGGNGGGYFNLNVSDKMNISGTILVTGNESSALSGGGAGSGGGVWLIANKIYGNGKINASGGNGASFGGGGGGGGRIYIQYKYNQSSITTFVLGGIGQNSGSDGTILWNNTNQKPAVYLFTQNYSNFSTNMINLTFNFSDDLGNANNVSLFINGIFNTSNNQTIVNSNNNFTVNLKDGTYTWAVNVTDIGNLSNISAYNTFTIDTTPPNITIQYPPTSPYAFDHRTNLNFNFTSYDYSGVSTCWWSNSSGLFNYSLDRTTYQNITNLSEVGDGSYNVTIWCNDTLNNVNSTTYFYTINSGSPVVNLVYPPNNTFFPSDLNTPLNFSVSDSHPISECQLWGNWTGSYTKNQTVNPINFADFDGYGQYVNIRNYSYNAPDTMNYTWCIWINGRNNFANVLPRIIDKKWTYLSIQYTPAHAQYSHLAFEVLNNVGTEFVYYGSTNMTQLQGSWHHVCVTFNTTNKGGGIYLDGMQETVTQIGGTFTGKVNATTIYNMTLGGKTVTSRDYNGSLNEFRMYNRTLNQTEIYEIYSSGRKSNSSLNSTGLVAWYPLQNTSGITAYDQSIYSNNAWTNTTWTSGDGYILFKVLNITDGIYNWNTWCNESSNAWNWSLQGNFTFGIDTLYPTLSISSISSTAGSQTIIFTNTANDTNLDTCKFSIYNSTNNIDSIWENVSVDCNLGFNPTVSDYATYTLRLYARDKAGNENYTEQQFTTSASNSYSIGGGGGQTNDINVVAIRQTNATAKTILERCILFSRIREYCNNKTCQLSDNLKESLLNNLTTNMELNLDDLNKWIEGYNANYLESVSVSKEDAIRYNLYAGLIQISGDFILTPSILDPLFTFVLFSNKFTYPIQANKVITNVSMVNGELGLSIEKTTDTTANVILNIENLDFSSKVFKGTANLIDIEGNSQFLEINLRVINLKSPITVLIMLAFIFLAFFMGYKRFKWRLKGGKK